MESFSSHQKSAGGVIRSSTKLLPALLANYEALLVRLWTEARSQVTTLNAQALKTTVDAPFMRLPMPILKIEERPRKGKAPWLKMVILRLKKSPKTVLAVGTGYRHSEFIRFAPRKDDGLIRLATVVVRFNAYTPEQLNVIAKMVDVANAMNLMIEGLRDLIEDARKLERIVDKHIGVIPGGQYVIDGDHG